MTAGGGTVLIPGKSSPGSIDVGEAGAGKIAIYWDRKSGVPSTGFLNISGPIRNQNQKNHGDREMEGLLNKCTLLVA